MEEELVMDIGDDQLEKMEESNAANVDDIGHKVDDLFAKVEKVKHGSFLTWSTSILNVKFTSTYIYA